jgi:hypothetical protein
MNIEGVVRQLPLFEPPIEPGQLVRAAAAGVDIGSALNDISAALPHYRFNAMLQKALELCNDVKSLGASLLFVLEKKDAEDLALLRSGHELGLLEKIRHIKEQQIEEAQDTWDGLNKAKLEIEARRDDYRDAKFMNESETAHLVLTGASAALQMISQVSEIAAGLVHIASSPRSTVPAVGASGAIAGVMAAYLALYPRAQILAMFPIFFWPVFFHVPAFLYLGFWFLMQFFSGTLAIASQREMTGIAVWAHIGGFAVGLLTFWVFLRKTPRPTPAVPA